MDLSLDFFNLIYLAATGLSCGSRSPEHGGSVVVARGFNHPIARSNLISPIRDWTQVPFTVRWILNYWTTREVEVPLGLDFELEQPKSRMDILKPSTRLNKLKLAPTKEWWSRMIVVKAIRRVRETTFIGYTRCLICINSFSSYNCPGEKVLFSFLCYKWGNWDSYRGVTLLYFTLTNPFGLQFPLLLHGIIIPTTWLLENIKWENRFKTLSSHGTSLVVQWLRICLPVQGTWIASLVRN